MAGPQTLYLGDPTGPFGMKALPQGFELDSGLGGREIAGMVNLSGRRVSVKRRPVSRPYELSWAQLGEDDFDLVSSFYSGLHGAGPFRLVDPSIANQLPYSASVFDKTDAWAPTAGTFAADSTAGPTGILSRVAGWTSATNTGFLRLAELGMLPPVLAGFTHGFSLYARTASSTANVALEIRYGSSLTPLGVGVTGSTVGLTTSWQRISTSVASTSLTSTYAIPGLKSLTSTPPVILIAAAGFWYDTAPTWRAGQGIPFVNVTDVIESPVSFIGARACTLHLQQAA